MSVIVPRTVTVVERDSERAPAMADRPYPRERSAPLTEFRSEPAYVLLGDPGAGKTTAFRTEAEVDPARSELVTARRFIARSLEHHPEWRGKTLFIDGLDEVRAGRRDGRTPLDHILARLERLGRPGFRLSCRAADWLGGSDLPEIVATAGYEDVRELQLDPLTDGDIATITSSLGEETSKEFVAEVSAWGMEGLLSNPHLLRLMMKAMASFAGARRTDERPRGRLDLLELACREIARERNDEHGAVHRASPSVSTDRILVAAGQLSALLLLSDRAYVSPDETDDPDELFLGSVDEGDQPALSRALKSNLFAATRDGLKPVHRQLAEFLAARFLHARIESGVPASRVLALMTGEDGGVVTELRGLSAWLAALEPASRPALIERDPIGIALYGDVGRFRQNEMESLFDAFSREADKLRLWSWPPYALASLIGRHTVELLNRYLADADRSEGRRAVVGLVLHALSGAEGVGVCRESLEGAVRDATWGQSVRGSALRALLRRSRNRDSWVRPLIALLDDLRDGTVEDGDRALLGRLLWALYPEYAGPERIWDYLVSAREDGHYGFFWLSLPEKSRETDLVPLLQSLVARGPEVWGNLAYNHLHGVVDQIIQAALETDGEDVSVPTLYDWLELSNSTAFDHSVRGHSALCRWLAARPALQKEMALEGLGRHSGHEDSRYRHWQVWQFVFRAGRPDDFPEWCLQQAVETAGDRMDMAVALLEWSGPWHDGDIGPGLSTDDVLSATAQIPKLQRAAEEGIDAQKEQERRLQVQEAKHTRYRSEQRQSESQFLSRMRDEAEAFREGKATPKLMDEVARAYHSFLPKYRADTPRDRVAMLLGGDADLADAAIAGFRRVADREDLPSLRDLIRLNQREMRSLLSLPLLAGLDASGPVSLRSRSPAEISRAAGAYLLTPFTGSGLPAWYRRALQVHPAAVAEALVKVTRSRIRGKRKCFYLWDLPRKPDYRAVARLAVSPLLRAFPTRCTEPQVSALQEVLLAAVRWEVDGVKESVAERVAKPDLDVAQRALWLAAGLCLSPEQYASQVAEFVESGEEARSQHVVRFLAPDQMEQRRMSWETGELKELVELLGGRYSPWSEFGGAASFVDEDRERVGFLIATWAGTLALRTAPEACRALQSLAEDPELAAWHTILRDKRDEQVVARRAATFAVPDLAAVQGALADREPASAADLAALVADRLEELGEQIGRNNTDDWRQYWNEDSHRRPTSPKHEESCRDALLSDLCRLLPESVDAQPEARYARDNRADIRVSFGTHAIPVEIKKDSHRALWSAVIDQLVGKYTIAPESSGFGIYLVLWFGLEGTPVPPTGRRPKTPGELRERLSGQLAGTHRHRVKVIVIDVSGSADSSG